MILLFRSRTGRSVRWIVTASCLVVFGVLCERYVIVLPGLTHPPELFPGMEVVGSGAEEGIVGYTASIAEIVQALGVFGFIGFLFVWGLKAFKLLPTEARIHGQPTSAGSPDHTV
jgi:Ni/Fe-hydrogenase subunit HybB-like protein